MENFTQPKNFKVDNESLKYGYELICLKCGFRIPPKMKDAFEKKYCPCCGNHE